MVKQKKYIVTSAIGKLSISFLALSPKHLQWGIFLGQLNLQQSERVFKVKSHFLKCYPVAVQFKL